MSKHDFSHIHVASLVQHNQALGLPKAKHPLFSIQRFEDFPNIVNEQRLKLSMDFYQITFKKQCPCKLKYGQTMYDFDEGVMSFFAPQQVSIVEVGDIFPSSGWLILIHPDFVRGSVMHQKMKSYGFFDYAVSESLILSESEEASIEGILQQTEREYMSPIDTFSQDVIVANIDLLLTYCNRYYNRQFITRKPAANVLLSRIDTILDKYFEDMSAEKGLPSVQFLASQLNLSPKYCSDCLKQVTGQTAQQYIQDKVIEHAKNILVSTDYSVGEIAYRLGFEYSQSFNKLFKSKTRCTPLEYRKSFH